MKIKSLTLSNYRQFKKETKIKFDQFNMLYGARGSGKTTFFDIFSWIMYGDSIYGENLLNLEKVKKMKKGDIQKVKGILEFYHHNNTYRVHRIQSYLCFSDNDVKSINSDLEMICINDDKKMKKIEKKDIKKIISEILPKFIFDFLIANNNFGDIGSNNRKRTLYINSFINNIISYELILEKKRILNEYKYYIINNIDLKNTKNINKNINNFLKNKIEYNYNERKKSLLKKIKELSQKNIEMIFHHNVNNLNIEFNSKGEIFISDKKRKTHNTIEFKILFGFTIFYSIYTILKEKNYFDTSFLLIDNPFLTLNDYILKKIICFIINSDDQIILSLHEFQYFKLSSKMDINKFDKCYRFNKVNNKNTEVRLELISN